MHLQWTQHLNITQWATIPATLRLLPDRELALTGWRTCLFPSVVIFLFTPRPGICESIHCAYAGLPVGIWMMNGRVKLSIFHIHNNSHTTRPRVAVIGAEAPRRLRRTVKKNTHIWMRPRNWSALETPNYAQELNRHEGASHFPMPPFNSLAYYSLWLKNIAILSPLRKLWFQIAYQCKHWGPIIMVIEGHQCKDVVVLATEFYKTRL